MFVAGVAHPVERHLAKVEVASSSLVARSIKIQTTQCVVCIFYFAVTMARKIKSQHAGEMNQKDTAFAIWQRLYFYIAMMISSHPTKPMMVRIVKNSTQFLMVFRRDSFL